jgi:thymidylate synthase (FAD)
MTDTVKVLDHGFIRLVDHMGGDLSVVRAARVSYDAAWRAGEDENSDAKLIRFLWRNRHTTPFEAVTFTFEVAAPIFVFRQWHRHRTFSFNELSGRYRPLPETYYLPDLANIGVQSKDSKQGRDTSAASGPARAAQLEWVRQHSEKSFQLYRALLADDWPKELARTVLPLNTYSHMFCTGNLLNVLKFMTLRGDPHAQYEIRTYAEAMRDLIRGIVPVCVEAWDQGTRK